VSNDLRELFLIDPDVVFLNHGSFGATPRVVFEEYQRWQAELERQPVEFLGRRADELLNNARAKLAQYLNADVDDLAFVTNATSGLNVIARSFPLETGDEILSTDHEYGALDLTWDYLCGKVGAHCIRHHIPLPVTTRADIVESFWGAVTPRTKIIFLSHITSPTALIFPVKEICARAREAGILTLIDGAHAPGQIPVNLKEIGADIYSGNCHKWMCAPKGSGFLHVRPEHHEWVESLTISWGWRGESTFVSRNQWQGTRDIAAFLSVPAAIEFQQNHNWDAVRARCHGLASQTRRAIADLTGLEPISPDSSDWFAQMVSCPIPIEDSAVTKARLYDKYKIEAPLVDWQDRHLIRVSYQGYNDHDDLEKLMVGLAGVFEG
jgi:isopenicillin-N epimerase